MGIVSLAALIGLIPVVAVTLIGIPLVPIAVVLLIVGVMIGYIAGTWFLATRVLDAFGWDEIGLGHRVVALAAGLVGAALLSLIPFIGWPIGLAFTFYGLGGVFLAAFGRWIDGEFHAHTRAQVEAMPD